MKILLLPILASYCLCSVALADDKNSLPDFAKAFPKDELIRQRDMPGFKSYVYTSDLSYPELKAAFLKFLGKGWIEVPMDEKTRKIANEGVAGNLLFSNLDFKDVQVGLTQSKIPVEGEKYLVSIVLMQKKAEQVVAPDR